MIFIKVEVEIQGIVNATADLVPRTLPRLGSIAASRACLTDLSLGPLTATQSTKCCRWLYTTSKGTFVLTLHAKPLPMRHTVKAHTVGVVWGIASVTE